MKDVLRALLGRITPFATLLWWASLAVVIVLTLTPGLGPPGQFGLDKVAHFLAFGWLALLAALVLPRRGGRWAVVVLLLSALGTEMAQMMIATRSSMIGDAVANLAGIVVGTTFGRALARAARPQDQESAPRAK